MSTPASSAARKLSKVLPGATRSAPLCPTRLSGASSAGRPPLIAGTPDSRCRRAPRRSAARPAWMLSPSGTSLGGQGQLTRRLAESQLDQEGTERRSDHRLAVEALEAEPLDPAPVHVVRKRLERLPHPRSRLAGGLDRVIAERDDAFAAALDVQRRLGVERNDVGARHARGAPSALLALLVRALGPRQRRAVGVSRVGRGEHERAGGLVGAQAAQALDRGGEGERRTA